jgi:hypothetical protein
MSSASIRFCHKRVKSAIESMMVVKPQNRPTSGSAGFPGLFELITPLCYDRAIWVYPPRRSAVTPAQLLLAHPMSNEK